LGRLRGNSQGSKQKGRVITLPPWGRILSWRGGGSCACCEPSRKPKHPHSGVANTSFVKPVGGNGPKSEGRGKNKKAKRERAPVVRGTTHDAGTQGWENSQMKLEEKECWRGLVSGNKVRVKWGEKHEGGATVRVRGGTIGVIKA